MGQDAIERGRKPRKNPGPRRSGFRVPNIASHLRTMSPGETRDIGAFRVEVLPSGVEYNVTFRGYKLMGNEVERMIGQGYMPMPGNS